ncbi:MAG TPA: acetylornithine transaminase [Chthonomonadales bacterium]|nr:acetylornithine transaminase [Chthonomonadales bacterium]
MTAGTPSTIDAAELQAWDAEYVMSTYARLPVMFVRGEGARLWDADGKQYLDFLSGIAVCGVGHCNPRVAEAIARQASTLMHTSNLFYTPLQPRLARRLCELAGMERAFFANSGAEANECALKIARKWAKAHRGPDCHEVITFEGSFHGRTMATIAATAQPKYQEPFRPLVPGFHHLPLGDLPALDAAIGERVCAVMIEPIQGESGVRVASPDFLAAVRALCDEARVLMIADEVQTGMGRTGHFLACQRAGVRPDIVTLAKSLAGGVPMGVCLASGSAARTLSPGDHASTFGGQPLACAAALAVLDVMEDERLVENAERTGAFFLEGLRSLVREAPDRLLEARGVGLMAALEFRVPTARDAMRALLAEGVVVNAIGDRILRFLPPLVVTEADCTHVLCALRRVLAA